MIELDVLNAMLAAGSTAKEIVRYIEATERVKSEKAAERRVKDRARKRKVRAQEKSAKSTTVSDGQVRTGAEIADKKEGFPQTLPKKITTLPLKGDLPRRLAANSRRCSMPSTPRP